MIRASYDGLDERWNERARLLNDRLAARGLPVHVANLVSVWTVLYDKPSRYNWLFQYYLRAEGLVLELGRHRPADLQPQLHGRRISAPLPTASWRLRKRWPADGWWWTAPAADNQAVRRTILRELLAVRLGRRRSAAAVSPPA